MAKTLFTEGPISPHKVAGLIENHQSKTAIGGHALFMGQVRADVQNDATVQAIEYTAYESMANTRYAELREEVFDRFDITCAHVYHSLGRIAVGELCFLVFTSAAHRRPARDANRHLVDTIKETLPIFGKEIFGNNEHQWKENQ